MDQPKTLEQALDRIEQITRSLEGGEVELDRSLALYEEGVGLVRMAEKAIREAEIKIEQLHADGSVSPVDEDG